MSDMYRFQQTANHALPQRFANLRCISWHPLRQDPEHIFTIWKGAGVTVSSATTRSSANVSSSIEISASAWSRWRKAPSWAEKSGVVEAGIRSSTGGVMSMAASVDTVSVRAARGFHWTREQTRRPAGCQFRKPGESCGHVVSGAGPVLCASPLAASRMRSRSSASSGREGPAPLHSVRHPARHVLPADHQLAQYCDSLQRRTLGFSPSIAVSLAQIRKLFGQCVDIDLFALIVRMLLCVAASCARVAVKSAFVDPARFQRFFLRDKSVILGFGGGQRRLVVCCRYGCKGCRSGNFLMIAVSALVNRPMQTSRSWLWLPCGHRHSSSLRPAVWTGGSAATWNNGSADCRRAFIDIGQPLIRPPCGSLIRHNAGVRLIGRAARDDSLHGHDPGKRPTDRTLFGHLQDYQYRIASAACACPGARLASQPAIPWPPLPDFRVA